MSHGGHGSSEFKRMLNGSIFLVAYGKKSLGEIFNKNMACGQKLFNSISLHKYNL